MTFACVLKGGGQYGVEHVARLRSQLPSMHDLVCLTDQLKTQAIKGVTTIPLLHGWPGWWSKIELFRPGLFHFPVIYMDLDVVVRSDPSHLICHNFTMCQDPIRPKMMNSSVMSWGEDLSHLYMEFRGDPNGYMNRFKSWPKMGDQAYLEAVSAPDTFPPGHIVSWRIDCADGVPESASIISFHGKPKPWEINL